MARFVFPDLLAGTFDLTVTMQGFKTYEQKGIALGATERVALRAIALDVGGVAETVTVQAEAVQVQTTNGARSGLITRDNDRGHRPQGPRLRRHAQAAARASSIRAIVKRRAGRA